MSNGKEASDALKARKLPALRIQMKAGKKPNRKNFFKPSTKENTHYLSSGWGALRLAATADHPQNTLFSLGGAFLWKE